MTIQPLGVELVDHNYPEELYAGTRIEEVRECNCEWAHAYARVANESLPFDGLVLHSGPTRFCCGGYFGGVQTRVYVLDEPVEEVAAGIRRGSDGAIRGLSNLRPPSPEASPRRLFPEWTSVIVRFGQHYGDYGGEAHMDFHVRRLGGKTLVLVFMYVGDGHGFAPLEATLASVRVAG